MGNTITIRLPDELSQWIDDEARKTGRPKSEIVREHLQHSRNRKLRQPFMDLAGTVEGTQDLSRKRGFER